MARLRMMRAPQKYVQGILLFKFHEAMSWKQIRLLLFNKWIQNVP